MNHILNLNTLIALALLSGVIAQKASDPIQHYVSDPVTSINRLSFDYPAGWQISGGGISELETVTLSQAGGLAQIIVNVQIGPTALDLPPVRAGIRTGTGPTPTERLANWRSAAANRPPCDFESARKEIAEMLTEKIAGEIRAITPVTTVPVTIQLTGSEIAGVQFRGVVDHTQVVADVYTTRLNHRFVSLVHIRVDDDDRTNAAFEMIRATLKLIPGRTAVTRKTGSPDGDNALIRGGVLNGKAIRLPAPDYPETARAAHASGIVVIQVTIDETGTVMSAQALSGHRLLQDASLEAARRARFSPTKLCGEPVRVTGVITYNFVAR
jgi:TonB family protein